jgi:alkanesulfonate monooxygenase SsuD/methylene tetrahydromethanopterin reductase-like flavin-dependent oxidoreductase (luciferase family)
MRCPILTELCHNPQHLHALGSALDGPQFAHELEVMGVPSRERVGRVVEGITILRRLWSEERVSHRGTYYRFADVDVLPKPVQQPVPILIAVNPKEEQVDAATTDRILRRVAAHADGWQTDATPVETFRQRFKTIQHYAAQQGRDGGELESCLHLMVNINEDRDQAFHEATTFLSSYYGAGAVSRERAEMWLAPSRDRQDCRLSRRGLHHTGIALCVAPSDGAIATLYR